MEVFVLFEHVDQFGLLLLNRRIAEQRLIVLRGRNTLESDFTASRRRFTEQRPIILGFEGLLLFFFLVEYPLGGLEGGEGRPALLVVLAHEVVDEDVDDGGELVLLGVGGDQALEGQGLYQLQTGHGGVLALLPEVLQGGVHAVADQVLLDQTLGQLLHPVHYNLFEYTISSQGLPRLSYL